VPITSSTLVLKEVDSDSYVDASIDNAHLADDAVGVAELSATGTASSSTFLRGDNAWAAAGGGAWNFIDTAVASGSASLTITGLDSTYDTYAIALSDMHPSDDNSGGHMRFGDSSGIDSASSDYSSFYQLISSGSYSGSGSLTTSSIFLSYQSGNAAGEGLGALLYLHRPGDGSTRPMISGTQLSINGSSSQTGGVIMGSRNAVITLDRILFKFTSGTVISGRMTVWGISHA